MSLVTRLASGGRTRDIAVRNTPSSGVRAPQVATDNVSYAGRDLPQVPNWDARSAVEQGYLGHPAVYSAVRTIAETVAALPFRAGKDPNKPGDYDHNAPLARLLGPAPGGPNPTTSSRALWAWTIAQRIVTGRFGWELERAPRSKQIVNVWPLVSQYLQPIPTVVTPGQKRPTTYFDKYRYNLPTGFVDLDASQVFYSWRPSQSDWRQAETVMQAARIPISIALALNRYHWGMLNNGMSGRKLIVTPPFAEPDQRRAWQEQFLAEMTGFDNAGKPAFGEATPDIDPSTGKAAPPSIQVIDLAQTSTDAELMALMEYMERAIYKAFSVPESEIGDASQRTYCADDTTEVLTADGWRRHDAVAPGTSILTLNHRTGSAEWQPIQNVNRFDVTDEPMLRMTGRTHDSLTTEAHRWPVLSRSVKDQSRVWKLSADLTEQHSIITAAPVSDLPTEPKHTDEFVELVAWHWTEGHVTRSETGALGISVITQSEDVNEPYCARIRGVLTRLFGAPRTARLTDGDGWRERHDKNGGNLRFVVGRNVTADLEHVAPDRRPSEAFIRSLTRAQLDLFIDVSMMADGTRTNQGSKVITQSKAERLDGIELATILSGRTPYRWTSDAHDGHCYHLAVSERAAAGVPRRADSDFVSAHREWTTYTGTVWCPTVSNGTWFARRNGKVYFTGNSNAGEEYRVFWTRTIVPLLTEVADDINTYLAPQLGDEVGWFDLSGVEVLQPAKQFTPEPASKLVEDQIITIGEARVLGYELPYDLPTSAVDESPDPEPAVDDPNINPTTHSSTSRAVEAVPAAVRGDGDIAPTAAMVALFIPSGVAAKVAVAGGVPADDMHVTLASLGKELTPEQAATARTVTAAVAAQHQPLAGSIGGLGHFPAGDDGTPYYAPVDVPGLERLREAVVTQLSDAGVPVSMDHGFTPHMTLTYITGDGPAPDPVPATPVEFTELGLAVGPKRTTYVLGGMRHAVIDRIDAIVARREAVKAGVRAENSPSDVAGTERLMAYWAEGKGAAKIAWGSDGDFDRCRVELGKYVGPKMVDGLCANLHHRATGAWPGHAPGESKARDAAIETETGSAGLLLPKAPALIPKPIVAHVYRPSKADRKKCATCGKGVTASGHLHTAVRGERHRGPHLPVKGGHANTPERARQAVRKTVDRHVTTLESQMETVLHKLFADQRKATVSRMVGNRGRQMIKAALRAAGDDQQQHEPTPLIDPTHIFDQTHWTDRTVQDIQSIMTAIGSWVPGHFATHTPGVADINDDTTAARSVTDLLEQATNRIAGQITDETFTQLQKALTDGVVAGDGYSGLAARVKAVFDEADTVRATRISRTEVQSAVNGASDTYANNLPDGVIGAREWLATPDARTRPAHAAAEGQQRAVGAPFDVGGAHLMFPGDPSGPPDEVIQCRCVLLYLPAGPLHSKEKS